MRSLLGATSLRASTRPRSTQPGDRLSLIVVRGGRCPIGIDLASGALVQTTHPLGDDGAGRHPHLQCFDVAVGRLADDDRAPELLIRTGSSAGTGDPLDRAPSDDAAGGGIDAWTPELAILDQPLRHIGHVGPRRAARYIRPVLHPRSGPILGFHGPAAPFWSIDGTGPTISIVRPDSAIGVRVSEQGVHAVFRWRGILHQLPLEAPDVLARLDWLPQGITSGRELHEAIRYVPHLIVVRLAAPVDGSCHKVAAGFIPRT